MPTNADEAGLRRLAAQLKAGQLVVRLFLRHTLHAKLYLLFRTDPINPIIGYLGSSNLTLSGLSHQGELNVDVLDHDAASAPSAPIPPIDESNVLEAPPQVAAIMERSCGDCHSNRTVWPWYSNVAPVSWLLVDHVNDARGELSISEFGTYSPKKAAHKFEEVCEMVQKGEMPLKSYLILHPDARLSDADRQTLCAWTDAERLRILSAAGVPPES